MPLLLGPLARSHPRLRVVIVDATTTSLVPQLVSGGLDLAVVNLPVVDPDIDAGVLFVEEHVLVLDAAHPLADRPSVSLGQLANVPLLLEPPGTGFRDDLDADASRLGVTLTAQAEVDGMRLLGSLATQGYGSAILPASAMVGWGDGSWVSLPLLGATPRAVGLATPRRGRLSAPARATADAVHAVIESEVPSRAGLHLPGWSPVAERGTGPVRSPQDPRSVDHR